MPSPPPGRHCFHASKKSASAWHEPGGRIEALFRADMSNTTEKRSVLHVALRAPASQKLFVDGVNGVDVVAEVRAVPKRMGGFAQYPRRGTFRHRCREHVALSA
ncbi:MAG: hypothetical protein ABI642_14360, partial [Polaromonas sp.]